MLSIAVVLGNSSEGICGKLHDLRDDLVVTPFLSLGELFRESSFMQDNIDRIIVSSSILSLGDIDDNILRLSTLLKEQDGFSNVVFLCKEETDSDLEEKLLISYTESECAVLSVLSTTISNIVDFATMSISDLQLKYGYESKLDFNKTSVISDSMEIQSEEELVELGAVSEQPQKDKSFFLNSLFGRGKKQERDSILEVSEVEVAVTEDTEDVVELTSSVEVGVDLDAYINDAQQEEQDYIDEGQEDDYTGNDDDGLDIITDELHEDYFTKPSLDANDCVTSSFEYNFDSSPVDYSNKILESLSEVRDTLKNEEVDDLGVIIEVDEEQKYRDKQVKIVEVERIVERVVNKGSNISIFSKQQSRIFLFTGDRCTGVTTNAFSIAKEFSKHKLSTLYVDCDISRHGLLSFIDYIEFSKNATIKKNAIHVCNNLDDMLGGAVKLSANLSMLTSDYGVKSTSEDIGRVLDLVSMYYSEFDVVIVDLPLEYLHCADSVLGFCKPVITVTGSYLGVLNFLCGIDESSLSPKYKNLLTKKGSMLLTGYTSVDWSSISKSISSKFDLDFDWLSTNRVVCSDITEKYLSELLEGVTNENYIINKAKR